MAAVLDEESRTAIDSQFDFSGGENSVADKILVRQNESTKLQNVLLKRGGGFKARKGYKAVNGVTTAGRWIREFDQTTGQLLSYEDLPGPLWYDDTMSPRARVLAPTPNVNDAIYFGGVRTKFFQWLVNFVYATAANTYVWECSNGAGGWIDKTAQVVESIATAKQLRIAGEVLYSWPDFSDWLPQQVETRNYGFWWRIRCTVGGALGGEVVLGQKRMRSDWLGQRKLIASSSTVIYELPGLSLTPRAVEVYQQGERLDGIVVNDHLYYHSGGQRPLMRWNGGRGVRRDGNNNNPQAAGLTKPQNNPVLTSTPVAAGYADGGIFRYALSYVTGPEGILGEGQPSDVTAAAAQITLPGAGGPHRVNIDFTAIRDAGIAKDVWAIIIYATRPLNTVDASERANLENFTKITTIVRDTATWVTGIFQDANVQRVVTGNAHPVSYDGTPLIKPRYIAYGGDRVWIADEHFVYASDIRRGDSYDPSNSFEFPRIRNIWWWRGRLLVFGDEKIWQISGINSGLPQVDDFWVGIGLAQPDSITVGDNVLYFISQRGPARVVGQEVQLIGTGRTWESPNYWNERVGEGRVAQGAYFQDRWWIPIDRGAQSGTLTEGITAVYDPIENGWTFLKHKGTGGGFQGWYALANIHGTLEHALYGQRILVGFPDGAIAGDADDLCILEYGTTDQWGAQPYDGSEPALVYESRALTMGAIHRSKEFHYLHARVKYPYNDVNNKITVQLLLDVGASSSQARTIAGNNAGGSYVDMKCEHNVAGAAGGGDFVENAPVLHVEVNPDSGFEFLGWWNRATVEEFAVDRQI